MKTYRFPSSVAFPVLLGGLTLGLLPSVGRAASLPAGAGLWNRVSNPQTANASGAGGLQVATANDATFSFGQVSGKPLRSANREELGTVTDFLIDPQSGQVRFAVVPSGGDPSNPGFRLVPLAALDAAAGGDGFTLRLDRGQWDQAGTITEREMQGKFTLNSEHQDRLNRQFALANQTAASGDLEVVRASQLRGQTVRANNDALGNISDVLIDSARQTAAIVLQPTGSAQSFIVTFPRLQFGANGQAGLTTNLSRADFQSAGLTPTGFASGQNPGDNMAAVNSAASAVQQTLARTAGGAGVQVVPESRIVLRGAVPNQQKKSELERAAAQAAPGVRIDSELTVRGW